jgi:hypothetical protein
MYLTNGSRAALGALALCVLTACGGGGNSADKPDVQAHVAQLPAEGNLTVDNGASVIAEGSYTVNGFAPGAVTQSPLTAAIQVEGVALSPGPFGFVLVYSTSPTPNATQKFGVLATNSLTSTPLWGFGCLSSAWSADDRAAVAAIFHTTAAAIPTCVGNIAIDATLRHAQFVGVSVPSLVPLGPSVMFSGNFGWAPPTNAPSLPSSGASSATTSTSSAAASAV